MFGLAGQLMWLKMTNVNQLQDEGLTVGNLELILGVCAATIRYNSMSAGVSTGQLKTPESPFQHHALVTMLGVRVEFIIGPAATTVMIQLTHVMLPRGKEGALYATVTPVARTLEEGE